MKAAIRVQGMNRVRATFASLEKLVPEGARKQMNRSAEQIVKVARIQTPADLENLENAIRILKSYGYRGRLQIDIGVEPTGEEVNYNGKPIDVNDYAAIIHENYEQYEPGENTKKKRLAYPSYYIGSGFLTRAVENERPKLQRQLVTVINRIILEETE